MNIIYDLEERPPVPSAATAVPLRAFLSLSENRLNSVRLNAAGYQLPWPLESEGND